MSGRQGSVLLEEDMAKVGGPLYIGSEGIVLPEQGIGKWVVACRF